MSRAPTGTALPSILSISPASLRAGSTPRAAMPTRATPEAPVLRSRISCAMRVSARRISASSMRRAAVIGRRRSGCRQGERPTARGAGRSGQAALVFTLPSRPRGTGLKGEVREKDTERPDRVQRRARPKLIGRGYTRGPWRGPPAGGAVGGGGTDARLQSGALMDGRPLYLGAAGGGRET